MAWQDRGDALPLFVRDPRSHSWFGSFSPALRPGSSTIVLGDVVAYVNLLDQRVLDSGSGPGHALSTSGDLFPNRMEGFEGLRPEAR